MDKAWFEAILRSFLNIHYQYGSDHPSRGLDCSGFVQAVLQTVGLDPPGDQSADSLYRELSKTFPKAMGDMQLGDVLFYGSAARITHVSIAIGKDHIIEAGGGAQESTNITNSRGYVRVRPKFGRKDIVAILRLPLELK